MSRIINSSKTKSKFTKEKSLFRFITKSYCEILKDEQKILTEKTLMFYKKAEIKYIEDDRNNLIGSEFNKSGAKINNIFNEDYMYYNFNLIF